MNNNLGTLFFNLLCNLGDYSNIYTATQVFSLYQIWNSWLVSSASGVEKLSKSSCGDSVVAQGKL